MPSNSTSIFHLHIKSKYTSVAWTMFRMERPDATRSGVEVLLNWVDVSYESLYRARSNTLYFNTATLSGDTSVTVTGLGDNDVWLLDVTDPDSPIRCTPDPGAFVPIGERG